MNRSRLLFIGFVALALGAFVSFVVYKNVLQRSTANSEPGSDVIVAAGDLQVGAKVQDGDVRMVKVPVSVVPPNSFRSKSQIIGRGVILPIQRGEFILPSKLAAENAGSGLPSGPKTRGPPVHPARRSPTTGGSQADEGWPPARPAHSWPR